MLVLVGTYTEPILFGTGQVLQGKGEGIHAYRLDESTATLRPIATNSGIANPSYLVFDASQKYLYAVNELDKFNSRKGGGVSALSIDPASGMLTLLNQQSSVGSGPCDLTVDRTGKNVLVANYGSGSVACLPIQADGTLSAASSFLQHEGKSVDSGFRLDRRLPD